MGNCWPAKVSTPARVESFACGQNEGQAKIFQKEIEDLESKRLQDQEQIAAFEDQVKTLEEKVGDLGGKRLEDKEYIGTLEDQVWTLQRKVRDLGRRRPPWLENMGPLEDPHDPHQDPHEDPHPRYDDAVDFMSPRGKGQGKGKGKKGKKGKDTSADAAVVPTMITVHCLLMSGRRIPDEGIELDLAAEGAVKCMRNRIAVELGTRCFSLSAGKKVLSNTKASAAELEFEEGLAITIVRHAPTEEQWRQWSELEEKAVARAPNFSEVVLNKEKIQEIGWPCIEQALMQTRAAIVTFTRCGLGSREVEIIAEAVGANSNLEKLFLNSNEIGDDGAAFLAQMLEKKTKIRLLVLCGNRIANKGAVALAKALENNKNFQAIILAGNRIDDDGAVAFAEAIRANPGLHYVNMEHNRLGDVGKNALLQAIWRRGNRHWTDIDI